MVVVVFSYVVVGLLYFLYISPGVPMICRENCWLKFFGSWFSHARKRLPRKNHLLLGSANAQECSSYAEYAENYENKLQGECQSA